MSAKTSRGAKRKCQNDECEASFYDLGREDFACPVCATEFDHEAALRALEPQPSRYPARKQPRNLPIVASAEPEPIASDGDVDDDLIGSVDDADDDEEAATSDVLLDDEEDSDLGDTIEIPLSKHDDES